MHVPHLTTRYADFLITELSDVAVALTEVDLVNRPATVPQIFQPEHEAR